MTVKESLGTFVGGGLFIGGWAISAAFIGYRTRDPIAKYFLGETSLLVDLAGILAGFVVVILGLVIGLGIGNLEKYKSSN